MAISNIITSPHCVCYLNSVAFARVCGLSYNIDSPRKPLHGIDVLQCVELVPVGLSISGTLQMYRMHLDGGAEAAGMLATWNQATKEKYASMYVLDRATDSVIVNVDKLCVTSQSWSITPKAFLVGTINWTGFGYGNESE